MPTKPPPSSSQPDFKVESLRERVRQLQDALRRIGEQRTRLDRRRRRHMMTLGVAVSALLHLGLLVYLAMQYRGGGRTAGPAPVSYEFAILQEEELTEFEPSDLEDLLPEVESEFDDLEATDAIDLEPAMPSAELEVAQSAAMPTLGGSSGNGDVGSLSGGGAGTSFFGVSSRGTRFAYIVDRSGSMGQGRKMRIAKRELARSISGLPDYASFSVVFFSTNILLPPFRNGWTRARKPLVNRFLRWLGDDVDPGGGTVPIPAFHHVFSLDVRPDVIFFLTDGEIPEETADEIAQLNRGGGRVIVNTIAFGDDRGQPLLERIAAESGGTYLYVPVGGP